MPGKIVHRGFTETVILKVEPYGVVYTHGAMVTNTEQFTFSQIDCVLMSADHVLSFQVGKQPYSVQTKPGDVAHAEVIRELLAGLGARG